MPAEIVHCDVLCCEVIVIPCCATTSSEEDRGGAVRLVSITGHVARAVVLARSCDLSQQKSHILPRWMNIIDCRKRKQNLGDLNKKSLGLYLHWARNSCCSLTMVMFSFT